MPQVASLTEASEGLSVTNPKPAVPVEKDPLAHIRCREEKRAGKSGMQASGPSKGLASALA